MLTYFVLSLLDGWMYQYIDRSSLLNIGEEKLVERINAPGWFLGGVAILTGSMDAKYVHFRIEIDGPEKAYPTDVTPYDVHEGGSVYPVNFGMYVPRYDDTNKYYVVGMAPSHPLPFTRRIEFKLTAPATPVEEKSAIPIKYRVLVTLIKVIDVEAFKRSLQKIISPR